MCAPEKQLVLTHNADHGKVVILAVLLRRLGNRFGTGPLAQQRFDVGKSEERPLLTPGFGNAIGQEYDSISGMNRQARLAVGCGFGQSQRYRSRERNLTPVEIRGGVSGISQCESSLIVKANHKAG